MDEATRKQLERGKVVTELMKQPQYQPLQVWEEALVLFCVEQGIYDDVDAKDALRFEKACREFVAGHHADLVQRIEEKKELVAEDKELLLAAVQEFKKNGTY